MKMAADTFVTSEGRRFAVPRGGLARAAFALLGVPHLGYRARLQRYREFQQLSPGARVVELGCGYGFLGHDLAPAPVRYAGLDRDAARLALARGLAQPVVRGDITRAPFRDNCAELVVLAEVLEHLPDPSAALAEAARLLVPGGRLLASAPSPDADDCVAFGHAREGFTRAALTALLAENGWAVEKMAPYGGRAFAAAWRAQRALPGGLVAATLWFLLMLPLLWLDHWLATDDHPIGWIALAQRAAPK